jgi:ABC-type nitrate/sulfonate/bicarbonate transport system permease component
MVQQSQATPGLVPNIFRSFWARMSRVYSIIGLLVLWEIFAVVVNNALFLPRLSDVLITMWEHLRSGELVGDIAISTFRCVSGFALAFIVGVPLGILMGWSARWDDFWNFIISFSNPIPKLGLIPLFILWLGIGEASKVAVIMAGALFPLLINTYSGVRGVGKFWLWRAATVGANQLEILRKVILPAALPNILAGARLGMAVSWILVLGAEMVAAQMGLGYRILYGQQTFDTRLVFSGLLAIAIIGFIFDRMILGLSSVLCRWHFRQADEFAAG